MMDYYLEFLFPQIGCPTPPLRRMRTQKKGFPILSDSKTCARMVCEKNSQLQGKGRFQSQVCQRTAYRRLCSYRVDDMPGSQKQADNRRGNPLYSGEDF